jgi:hypothetical protein
MTAHFFRISISSLKDCQHEKHDISIGPQEITIALRLLIAEGNRGYNMAETYRIILTRYRSRSAGLCLCNMAEDRWEWQWKLVDERKKERISQRTVHIAKVIIDPIVLLVVALAGSFNWSWIHLIVLTRN